MTYDGSGSGDPSGEDPDEEMEPEGSGFTTETSGTEDPVGKSIFFHFIIHNIMMGGAFLRNSC